MVTPTPEPETPKPVVSGLRLRAQTFGDSKKPSADTWGGDALGMYLEVRCTYNLLSSCSYNLIISPISTVTLDIIGL